MEIAVVFFILGGLTSFLISRYYYKKSIQKVTVELIHEIIIKSNKDDYKYNDAIGEYLYKTDVKLKFVMERKGLSKRQFPEPWVEKFANINAYSQPIYIYYENTRIDTVLCVYVDSLYLIPYPKSSEDLTISNWQYKIGQIINNSKNLDFDSALQQAGITVEE